MALSFEPEEEEDGPEAEDEAEVLRLPLSILFCRNGELRSVVKKKVKEGSIG